MVQDGYIRDGRAPLPENEMVSKVMCSNKGKNTTPEIVLRKHLWKNGFRGYRVHKGDMPGSPDIVYSKKRLAIFVNGCFWHRCPRCDLPLPKTHTDFWKKKFQRNIERDKEKIDELRSLGWKVITIWECEIKKDISSCVERIRSILEE